ncbi:acetyltransferase [uncultured Thiodictyon sp.]|uniref:acetyltransferase n=1 Tax=uncultured Thiodictyon sp. TaxID=1846217 RepID=UPI0025E61FAD|nr:acetyltransferase [uncultured Thiodictyon sp.]
MTQFDVFNGDADGICALLQLRFAQPLDSTLVTGVKRDIALLERVPASAGDQVTVLDIALDKNRVALARVLAAGARVRYFDHHYSGEIPRHPGFACHIETGTDKGTSLLVDEFLGGRFRAWAVVGTFGDNFDAAARRAAAVLGLAGPELERLRELGICINYNGYGAEVTDLHCPPDELYRRLRPYADPLAFMREDPTYPLLRDGYAHDMARAQGAVPTLALERHCLHILPGEPWARRVGGVFANALAQQAPGRAHALLTQLPQGGFLVSVRAPLARPQGADQLCRQFATGGGRAAAAGINHLPDTDYDRFTAAFIAAF